MHAIEKYVHLNIRRSNRKQEIVVMSDNNQATIKSLNLHIISFKIVLEWRKTKWAR